MRVAALQSPSSPGDWQRNAEIVRRAANSAAASGVQLLVTPELFLSSYRPAQIANDPGQDQRKMLAEIAAEAGVHLVASTVEAEGEDRYISASLFSDTGEEITRYRKQHMFGDAELAVFTPGTVDPQIIEVLGWKVALGICFDVEFPEFVRQTALDGAELLLIPTAVPLRPDVAGQPHALDTRMLSTLVVPCRAYESQIFIVYSNHSGPGFSGLSTIADPFGQRLATAQDDEQVLLAELDRSRLALARESVDYLEIARAVHPTRR
ncbi:nitrilase-related carbon-nitrogen hydrolase [Glutamicibacter arilaitensis]|uniref:nitrilase-related carbon-nitrogen hydrolase n=1 Tax=Glutamicibacter arilaitensis TaxID=256701 RepID=UPI00384C38EF